MTTSQQLSLVPVVAFDVDGVLRIRPLENFPQEIISVDLTKHQDEYPDIFHGQPSWDELGEYRAPTHFSKTAVDFLRRMTADASVEPVWATTWQRWANLYFSKPLGLPELPVAVKTLEPESANWASSSPSWKSKQLGRQFDGRPLIWLDDNLPDRPGERLIEQRRPSDRALTLSYQVNPYIGITAKDVSAIDEWLALASTSSGQAKLREDYSELLKQRRQARAKDARRRTREREMFDVTLAAVERLLPGQEYLGRQLANMARNREGLTTESVSYALRRHSVTTDPAALAKNLRVRGYHRATVVLDESES